MLAQAQAVGSKEGDLSKAKDSNSAAQLHRSFAAKTAAQDDIEMITAKLKMLYAGSQPLLPRLQLAGICSTSS